MLTKDEVREALAAAAGEEMRRYHEGTGVTFGGLPERVVDTVLAHLEQVGYSQQYLSDGYGEPVYRFRMNGTQPC